MKHPVLWRGFNCRDEYMDKFWVRPLLPELCHFLLPLPVILPYLESAQKQRNNGQWEVLTLEKAKRKKGTGVDRRQQTEWFVTVLRSRERYSCCCTSFFLSFHDFLSLANFRESLLLWERYPTAREREACKANLSLTLALKSLSCWCSINFRVLR